MKRIFIISIAMIVSFAINAQDVKSVFTKEIKVKTPANNLRGVDDMIFVQDSSKTFNYDGVLEVWDANSKVNTLTRYENGKVKTQSNSDSSDVNGWEKSYLEEFSYLNSGEYDIYLIRPWNSNFFAWDVDTALYYNATEYTTNIFGGEEPVYEDKVIEKDWDAASNQFDDGIKYDINLIQDSLYSVLDVSVWDAGSSMWGDYVMKMEFTYNDDNSLQTRKQLYWNGTEWENGDQTLFAYLNGDLIQDIDQSWNGSEWENEDKDTYTYDVNHNMTNFTDYNYNGSAWEENYKYDYTYDSNNNRTEQINSDWDGTEWIDDYKYTYNYDVNNNLLNQTSFDWNITTEVWDNSSQEIYAYNSNNDMTEQIYRYWDGTNLLWVNSSRYAYEYNSNFDRILYSYQGWDGSAWADNYQRIYTYDENNNLTEYLEQDWDGSEWLNDDKEEYYWSEFNATDIKEVKSDFSVYPNPTSGLVNIINTENNFKSIKIVNILGKTVYSSNNSTYKKETINLKEFGAGIYIINAKTTNNEEFSSRVIVR